MSSAAQITSIDTLAELKAALVQFDERVADAIVQLNLAARRPLEWLDHDRSQYWPRAARQAADGVSEAKLALARAQTTIDVDDHRACYEERKLLEKAERRLETAERKLVAVRRWKVDLRKEVEEFEVQSAKLQHFLEGELPRALAELDRMAGALEKYVRVSRPGGDTPPAGPAAAEAAP